MTLRFSNCERIENLAGTSYWNKQSLQTQKKIKLLKARIELRNYKR